MSDRNLHRAVVNLAKVAGAGATIAAVALCVLTFGDTRGNVPEAKADIWGLSFAGNSKQKQFVDALSAQGMEDPRAFDWNGNTIFFSTKTTTDKPKEVLHKFQEEFVLQGLNNKMHLDTLPTVDSEGYKLDEMSPEQRKRAERLWNAHLEQKDDFFTGGVVPILVNDNAIQMAGMETKGKATSAIGMLKEVHKSKRGLAGNISSMRYVDAADENGKTRVTATWSDGDLEMGRFLPPKHRRLDIVDADTTIDFPLCLGCERMTRFAGLSEGDRGYATNILSSPQGPTETLMFYDQALEARGWKMAKSTRTVLAAKRKGLIEMGGGQLLNYARGKEFVSVVAYPEEFGSIVQLVQSR